MNLINRDSDVNLCWNKARTAASHSLSLLSSCKMNDLKNAPTSVQYRTLWTASYIHNAEVPTIIA